MEHNGCLSTKIIAVIAGTVMALVLFIPTLWLWGNILALNSIKACGLESQLEDAREYQSVTICHELDADVCTTWDVMDDSWAEEGVKKAREVK